METKITSKNAKYFFCEICDFKSSKKGDYNRHMTTAKHKNKHLETEITSFTSNQYNCNCGKKYRTRAGLYKHELKCSLKVTVNENKLSEDNKDLINYLMTENKDLKKMLIENCGHNTTTTNNTTNNISNNQNFNINIFLNEQCKDAMNMTEFIESIQLTLEDMTKINIEGQTKGMSNILIDKLNDLDIFKRPVHCSDVKKEIIYIKDQDKWEEENKDKSKIRNALDKITMKSIETLPSISQDPDDYVKTVNELLKEPREDKKIISKLAKEILV
jgi:hypothetical protein